MGSGAFAVHAVLCHMPFMHLDGRRTPLRTGGVAVGLRCAALGAWVRCRGVEAQFALALRRFGSSLPPPG